MKEHVVNNLQEELNWLESNPTSTCSGFSYSPKLFDQPKDGNIEFQFSERPKKTFAVLKFLPIQGKAISDFLPGFKDDADYPPSKLSTSKPANDYSNRPSTDFSNSFNITNRAGSFSNNNNGSNFGNNGNSFGTNNFNNGNTSNFTNNFNSPNPKNNHSNSTSGIDFDNPLSDFPGQSIIQPQQQSFSANKETVHILSPSKNFSQISADSTSKWRGNYDWTEGIDIILHNTFGYHKWRSNQKEIINATMSGKDVFVTMPTGGGKSLCYQIPAACSEGVSIVISPLISLIEDQVMIARSLDLKVDSLSSKEDNSTVWRDLCSQNPEVRLLFVTPEKLAASPALKEKLTALAKIGKLDRFVIDEAHCVSQWGHDFRPDYCKLSELKKSFPYIPILAMTATATQKAKKDIITTLGINNCEIFSQSFNRTNLWYEIKEKKKNSIDDIVSYINTKQKGKSGIIYCLSKKECEDIAKVLKEKGINASYYHAGIKDSNTLSRSDVQADWSSGKTKVVVATIAFGMGINKSDVRFVIHYCLPKSLEGFYQESGRAGRDGKDSDCILYYNYKDKLRLENVMDKGFQENRTNFQVQKNQKDGLNRVVSYCQNTIDCRRQLVLNYFGEAFQASACAQNCDNCAKGGQIEEKNLTEESKQLVEIVQFCEKDPSIKNSATIIAVTAVFRGTKGNKKLDKCPNAGLGKGLSKDDVARLIHELALLDVLREAYMTTDFGSTISSLRIGPAHHSLRQGTLPIVLKFRKGPQKKAAKEQPEKKERKKPKEKGSLAIDLADDDIEEIVVSPNNSKSDFHKNLPKQTMLAKKNFQHKHVQQQQQQQESLEEQLLKRLQELAAKILSERARIGSNTDTSILISLEALEIVAKEMPRNEADFTKIEGIGLKRAEKFGDRFISTILEFVEEHPEIDEKLKAAAKPATPIFNKSTISDSNTDSSQKRKIQAAPYQPANKKVATMPASSNNNTSNNNNTSGTSQLQRSPTNLTNKYAYSKGKNS
jgi:RecQ family ATP-dependent DNA helicase